MEMFLIFLFGCVFGVFGLLAYNELHELVKRLKDILDEERALNAKDLEEESGSSENSGS